MKEKTYNREKILTTHILKGFLQFNKTTQKKNRKQTLKGISQKRLASTHTKRVRTLLK